jgi:hypothetical protein
LYQIGEAGRKVKRKDAAGRPMDTALFGRLEKSRYVGG